MKKRFCLAISLLCTFSFAQTLYAQKKELAEYNVQWNTPGINSQGSMPIGNGDIGANVWGRGKW
jgi:hypothetical protein